MSSIQTCLLVCVMTIFVCDSQATSFRKIINSPNLPDPQDMGLPISEGVLIDKTLYTSGYIGIDLGLTLPRDFKAQARKTLENIGHVLTAAGTKYENVVQVVVKLTDISKVDEFNKIYAEFFKTKFPARSIFQVPALTSVKGVKALVEIQAIAVVGTIVDV